MSRWEQKRQQDNRERPQRVTPARQPVREGRNSRRGGGARNNREPFQMPSWLQPAVINTPRNGQRPKPEKPAAPPKADIKPTVAPTPAPLPSPAPPTEVKDERTNSNGIKQYGRDLSSLNTFTSAFTGGYEIADIKTAFKSNDLPTAQQEGTNTDYSVDDATAMGMPQKDALTLGGGGTRETVFEPNGSTTTTLNPASPQDGTSDKPDVAESIRQVRMRRKGPRDEGSFRGFQIDQANKFAQNSVSETKGNGMNARRREIRSTFLNHEGNSIQAITAARSVAGVGNDSNGSDVYNVGGELVYAKPGEERKAINAAMSGNNPMPHLDVPTTPDTQPDTPAASELSPSFAKETPGAQEFFKNAISKVKDKNK